MGTGNDTANAVVFLALDAVSYITGLTLNVSGGFNRKIEFQVNHLIGSIFMFGCAMPPGVAWELV